MYGYIFMAVYLKDRAGIATGTETENIILLWYLCYCKQTDIANHPRISLVTHMLAPRTVTFYTAVAEDELLAVCTSC